MKNIINNNKIIQYGKTCENEDEEVFYLNHSCDEWVIGNIEEAKAFLQELQDKIRKVENNN